MVVSYFGKRFENLLIDFVLGGFRQEILEVHFNIVNQFVVGFPWLFSKAEFKEGPPRQLQENRKLLLQKLEIVWIRFSSWHISF